MGTFVLHPSAASFLVFSLLAVREGAIPYGLSSMMTALTILLSLSLAFQSPNLRTAYQGARVLMRCLRGEQEVGLQRRIPVPQMMLGPLALLIMINHLEFTIHWSDPEGLQIETRWEFQDEIDELEEMRFR
jgi:hypothetical protein